MRWTPEQRADAIGRALAVGAIRASEATGVPRRTIDSWLSGERSAPELEVLKAASYEQILDTLKAASAEGAADLLRIIRDPKASDRDKVRASEVALDRYNLLSGGATARTESQNFNVSTDLQPLVTTAEVRAELLEWMTRIENATDDELAEHEAKVGRVLEIAQRVLTIESTEDADED